MIDTNDIRQRLIDCDVSEEDVLALCDEIDRLRAGKQKPAGKTVNVKVAVAVDKNGDWKASGSNGDDNHTSMQNCLDFVAPGESQYWLTADLPIPQEVEVEAEVENAIKR